MTKPIGEQEAFYSEDCIDQLGGPCTRQDCWAGTEAHAHGPSLADAAHEAEHGSAIDAGNPPPAAAAESFTHISTIDDDGRLVTAYNCVPAAGERGWYVKTNESLDEGLADILLNGPMMDGYYGWPANGDEAQEDLANENLRVITVEESSI